MSTFSCINSPSTLLLLHPTSFDMLFHFYSIQCVFFLFPLRLACDSWIIRRVLLSFQEFGDSPVSSLSLISSLIPLWLGEHPLYNFNSFKFVAVWFTARDMVCLGVHFIGLGKNCIFVYYHLECSVNV